MAQQTDAGEIEVETVDDIPRTTVAGVLDLVNNEIENQQSYGDPEAEYTEELWGTHATSGKRSPSRRRAPRLPFLRLYQ